MELLMKGGLVMGAIGILSIAALTIIIERLIYLKRISVDDETLMERLKGSLSKGHYDEALNICDQSPGILARLMRVGIQHRDESPSDLNDAVQRAANLEVPRLERYLTSLGTIAHVTPLLGLLGTVTGNIRAFGVLGQMGSVGDPALLAGGISEALLTTAAGLIVSIPAIAFYNYLVSRVNHMVLGLENRTTELVRFLTRETQK